jgi:hypothetical protein
LKRSGNINKAPKKWHLKIKAIKHSSVPAILNDPTSSNPQIFKSSNPPFSHLQIPKSSNPQLPLPKQSL